MKNILIALFVICFTTGCDKGQTALQNNTLTSKITEAGRLKALAARRHHLMNKAGKGMIILRSDYGYNGGRHEFRSAGNFYYLTGFAQPGSLLILDPESKTPYSLFITEKATGGIIYSGEAPGKDYLKATVQPDTILSLEKSDKFIEDCFREGKPVYIDFTDTRLKAFILEMADKIKADTRLLRNIAPELHEMRVIKDPVETTDIRKAVDITGEAFLNACSLSHPGVYEYETEAIIEYTFRKFGSPMPAFQSIVGSGPNGVILHYSENNRQMLNGDLLLMDIGTEVDYRCSDITRTIPVNGKFSKEQREIYDLVLNSQKAAIREMKPGNYLLAGHNASTRILVNGLFELGLITDTTSIWQKKFYILYPVSHYLGLDVHDVGDYGATYPELLENIVSGKNYGRKLESGMVLTVEPGLYLRSEGLSQLSGLFSKEATGEEIKEFTDKVSPVYEKYKNIGIRIEDDILITETGCEVLSKEIPKEADQIEEIMKKNKGFRKRY